MSESTSNPTQNPPAGTLNGVETVEVQRAIGAPKFKTTTQDIANLNAGGIPIVVTDGTTTITNTATLAITSNGTVTSGGAGIANLAIAADIGTVTDGSTYAYNINYLVFAGASVTNPGTGVATVTIPPSLLMEGSASASSIGNLPTASALTGAELAVVVQGTADVQTTAQDIANLGGIPFTAFSLPLTSARNADGSSVSGTTLVGGYTSNLTNNQNLVTETANSSAVTDAAFLDFILPQNFPTNHELTITVNAKQGGSLSVLSVNTITPLVIYDKEDGTRGVLSFSPATASPTTSFADYTFTTTGSTLHAGQRIEIRLTWAMTETAGHDVVGNISRVGIS